MNIFLIWLIGLSLTIRAVIEISQLDISANKKRIAILIVILTSWLGAFFYTFYAKDKLPIWLNRKSKHLQES